MVTNIIIALWIVFMLFLVYRLLRNIFKERNESIIHNFPFQYVWPDIPFITIDVQGNALNMIVDSGAAVSIISKDILDSITYEETDREYDLVAMTNESVPSNAIVIPITVNGKDVYEDFVVHSVEDLAGFKARYGVTIHGILGYNFLKKSGCKVDFENKKLVV